jgi:hypothetical protein
MSITSIMGQLIIGYIAFQVQFVHLSIMYNKE